MLTTTTNLALDLFDRAGDDAEVTTVHPHRRICVPVIIRHNEEELDGHTISVSPDTIDLDCHEELQAGDHVSIRLANADGPETNAVVMHCTGTIVGFTVGITMH
jgi:hypothetical protein